MDAGDNEDIAVATTETWLVRHIPPEGTQIKWDVV